MAAPVTLAHPVTEWSRTLCGGREVAQHGQANPVIDALLGDLACHAGRKVEETPGKTIRANGDPARPDFQGRADNIRRVAPAGKVGQNEDGNARQDRWAAAHRGVL